MHALQHILLSLYDELQESGAGSIDWERFEETVPYTILPDAARFYLDRRHTHFEINHIDAHELRDAFNGIVYPEDLREFPSIAVKDSHSPIEERAVGGYISLDAFHAMNQHLHPMVFGEIREHLEQDRHYDLWIREKFDCFRSDGMYIEKESGTFLDHAGFRELVAYLEADSAFYVLNALDDEFGVVVDEGFLKEHVYEPLRRVYDEAMYENTVKFLDLDALRMTKLTIPVKVTGGVRNRLKEEQRRFVRGYMMQEGTGVVRSRSNWAG